MYSASRFILLLLASSSTGAAANNGKSSAIEGFHLTDTSGASVLTQLDGWSQTGYSALRLQFLYDGVTFDMTLSKEQRSAFTDSLKITSHGTRTSVRYDVPAYHSKDRRSLLHLNHDGTIDALVHRMDSSILHVQSSTSGRLQIVSIPDSYLSGVSTSNETHNNVIKTHPHTIGRRLTIQSWVGDGTCYDGDEVKMELKIGVAIDSELYEHLGSIDKAVMDYVSGIILRTNKVYEAQLGIVLFVDHLYIQKPGMASPTPDWNTGSDIEVRHKRLSNWVAPSEQAVWHLIGHTGFDSGMAGLSSVGQVCMIENMIYLKPLAAIKIGSLAVYGNRAVTWHHGATWATFAHELGHSFGAEHSFEEGMGTTGGLMDYGDLHKKSIDGSQQFNSKYRKSEMCAVIQRNMIDRNCDGRGGIFQAASMKCSATAKYVVLGYAGSTECRFGYMGLRHAPPVLRADLFAPIKQLCGNGVVEAGEECECLFGNTSCTCCNNCVLDAGKMCTPDRDACCTSECEWARPADACAITGSTKQGFCANKCGAVNHFLSLDHFRVDSQFMLASMWNFFGEMVIFGMGIFGC